MKTLIQKLLDHFGYTLTRTPKTGLVIDHNYQDFVNKSIDIVRPFSMLRRERLSLLFEAVQYVNKYKIPGDIIECGVWKGGAMGMLAQACLHFSDIRSLRLFDCFDDICEPDARIDGESAIRIVGGADFAHGRMQPIKGIYDALGLGGHGTVDICKKLLSHIIGYPIDKCNFYKGWFQETMADKVPAIKEIAILRLDADWYASTKICLETFYERVVLGGMVIIDDYGCFDGCRKAIDDFIKSIGLKVFRNHVDDECIYWFKS